MVESVALGWSLEFASRLSVLCWCVWEESGFIGGEDFSRLIYFVKELYKMLYIQ
jgi:hypothetical protein